MGPLIRISALIICQNSEKTIQRTLDSLKRFAQVVVIDGGSTDQTQNICSQYQNVKFITNPWPGFTAQRNLSLMHADYPWCFMIDSDEAMTPELIDEIEKIMTLDNSFPIYAVMRTEYFLGQAINVGIGQGVYQERLFLKERIQYTGGVHHRHLLDGVLVEPRDKRLGLIPKDITILHDPHYNVEAWMDKFNRFAITVAIEKIRKGRSVSALEAFLSFFLEFFKVYLKSFKGGRVSFILCLLHALHKAMVKIYIYQYRHFPEHNSSAAESRSLG